MTKHAPPPATPADPALYLCMGSACHQMGVYQVLSELQRLLDEHGLSRAVELKGAFCLECCADGIVLKHRETLIRHINPGNIQARFLKEILPMLRGRLGGGGGGPSS